MRLLDPRFRYVPAAQTDVLTTWRRFGFRPTTESERRARQRAADAAPEAGNDVALAPKRPPRLRAKPALKLA